MVVDIWENSDYYKSILDYLRDYLEQDSKGRWCYAVDDEYGYSGHLVRLEKILSDTFDGNDDRYTTLKWNVFDDVHYDFDIPSGDVEDDDTDFFEGKFYDEFKYYFDSPEVLEELANAGYAPSYAYKETDFFSCLIEYLDDLLFDRAIDKLIEENSNKKK